MADSAVLGVAVALASGLMVGVQATFFTLLGRSIGPARASLLLNVTGGLLGGTVVLAVVALRGREAWSIPRSVLGPATIAVILGMLIVMGVAFSFPRMGLAAGVATVFLGQMLVGVLVDVLGRAGGEPIPLDLRRILGLVILAVALAFLLPRQ
jgi:uncharacterized membrane protein YdcZ (DUF606 family)